MSMGKYDDKQIYFEAIVHGRYVCEYCGTFLFQGKDAIDGWTTGNRLEHLLDNYNRIPKICSKCGKSTEGVKEFISGQIMAVEEREE